EVAHLSLHDALPIWGHLHEGVRLDRGDEVVGGDPLVGDAVERPGGDMRHFPKRLVRLDHERTVGIGLELRRLCRGTADYSSGTETGHQRDGSTGGYPPSPLSRRGPWTE